MQHPKTTICGLIALAGSLTSQFFPEYARLGAFLASFATGAGLILAADGKAADSPAQGPKLGLMAVFLGGLLLFTGCAHMVVENVHPDGSKTKFSALLPAYPWQDSQQTLSKLTVSQKTNGFAMGLNGLATTETGSTNLSGVVEALARGVMSGIK